VQTLGPNPAEGITLCFRDGKKEKVQYTGSYTSTR